MRFAHTNIASKNWRSLADFYINVFDCQEVLPERKLSGDWLDRATGLKNAKLSGIHLRLPGHGDNGPTLEIFTYEDMSDSSVTMANHTGFTHIAFEVENVEQTLKKALDNGGELLGKVTEKEIENVGTIKLIYFRDPEGNIIEIQSWEK